LFRAARRGRAAAGGESIVSRFDATLASRGQRISHVIVMTDALNICKLKKRLLTQRRAS